MQPSENGKPTSVRAAASRSTQQVPSILSTAPTPVTLLRSLRRRLVFAVSLGLILGVVVGAVVWRFSPASKPTIRARLEIPRAGHYLVQTSEQLPDQQSNQRHHLAMAKNSMVLGPALQSPEVAKLSILDDKLEPQEWVENNLQVGFPDSPQFMQFTMRGTQTDELVILVDAIVKAHRTEVVEREVKLRRDRQAYITKKIEEYESILRQVRDTEKNATGGLGGAAGIADQIFAFKQTHKGMLERELMQYKSKLRDTTTALTALESQQKSQSPIKLSNQEINDQLEKEPEMVTQRKEIARIEQKLAGIAQRAQYPQSNTGYIQASRDLGQAKAKAKEIEERLRPMVVKQMEGRLRQDSSAQIYVLKRLIKEYTDNIKILDAEVDTLQKAIANGGKAEDFRLVISPLEDMLKKLRTESEALKVELEAPRDTRMEKATVLRSDDTTKRIMMAGGSGGASLCLVLFCIAYLEYRNRRLSTPDEVLLGLGMRILGTVPKTAKRNNSLSSKSDADRTRQVLTESVNAARTNLLHLARTQTLRTVMVTSGVAGEGKTSLSCHLAVSLARGGLRTLLIDGDLRNPSVHRLFGIPCEKGFNEVLAGTAEFTDCVQDSGIPNLSILAAGQLTDAGLLSLTKGGLRTILERLVAEYDFILLDSSPVLPVADALLMGQQVDGVLLSVLCEESRLPNIYAAQKRIDELGIPILGVVVNGVMGSLYGASYNYPYPRKRKATVPA